MTPERRSIAWVSSAFVAGVLLNADRVPSWVPLAAVLIVAWRVFAPSHLPGTVLRSLIAFALVGAVLAKFRTLNGLSAGTALLILMGATKLLETRQRRDQYIVIGSALFLLLAASLDRQELLRAPLYLLHAWLCCAALAVVSYATVPSVSRFDDRTAILVAGRALLLALPLALLLFVFFPRVAGAFWSLPRAEAATTGLGDSMSPGGITELTSSYEIAFRARFESSPPPPQELYWRGPVMHDFDGYTWRRTFGTAYKQKALEYAGTAYRYRISLEPSSQRWWFSLDTLKYKPEGRVFFTDDYELIGFEPVSEATGYDAVSYTKTRSLDSLTPFARRRDTKPSPKTNERSKQFARELRGRSSGDQAFVDAVLDFFRTGGFEYTVTPPRLGPDSVDDFIFQTRRGFCGHFASAFVTLMRAGGVPAHIVTGYLGGEWNPVGGYYIVRQSDAHAWAEVWLEGRGWTRVDPTAVVEPERLRRGIYDLLPDAANAPTRLIRNSPWLMSMLQRWDAMNTWWNDRVLKFDFKAQLGILERLGIDSPDLGHLGWSFALGLIGWMSWIAWQIGRSAPVGRPDRLARAYTRLCNKLARAGVLREPHQGPLSYAETVSQRRPDLAAAVRALANDYARLRFGRAAQNSDLAEIANFERSVASFRPRASAPS